MSNFREALQQDRDRLLEGLDELAESIVYRDAAGDRTVQAVVLRQGVQLHGGEVGEEIVRKLTISLSTDPTLGVENPEPTDVVVVDGLEYYFCEVEQTSALGLHKIRFERVEQNKRRSGKFNRNR